MRRPILKPRLAAFAPAPPPPEPKAAEIKRGTTLCEALLAPVREGRQGAAAALVSRGTAVPLSRTKNIFQWQLALWLV